MNQNFLTYIKTALVCIIRPVRSRIIIFIRTVPELIHYAEDDAPDDQDAPDGNAYDP